MQKDYIYLNDLAWSYRSSRVLQVAAQLRIFTYLNEKALTCDELAHLTGAKADMLEKVLIACAAMGLLHRDGQAYSNTQIAENYLVSGKPLYQGDIICHSAKVWDFWDSLPDQIMSQPAQPEEPQVTHRNFILGMNNITLGGRGQLFLDCIDLSGRKQLFDVGGGPGTYSILACEKYPQLKAIVFDLPETIAIARQIIKDKGLSDRISVREGSWESHDFGQGNDVVLMSNILHGPSSMAEMKLAKAFQSLTPGGLLVIQEFMLDDSKEGPLIPALFNVMVGAYSESELISVIINSGFSNPVVAAKNEQIGAAWITAQKQ